MIETDTAQAQGGFLLAARRGDDHNGLGTVEYGPRPGRVLSPEPNVNAPGQVPVGVLVGIADVQNLSSAISHPEDFGKIDGMEYQCEILVQRSVLPSVEDRVIGKVRRSVGLVGRDKTNKFLLRHGLQCVV